MHLLWLAPLVGGRSPRATNTSAAIRHASGLLSRDFLLRHGGDRSDGDGIRSGDSQVGSLGTCERRVTASGCVLRASGKPVDLDRCTLREGSRFSEVKRYVRATVEEQPRALAYDHRDGDKFISSTSWLSSSQRTRLRLPCTCGSPAGLAFQLADGRREVAGEDSRVRPARFGERGRCRVLGSRVQASAMGPLRICHCSPIVGEELVYPPAEQGRRRAGTSARRT